MEVLDENGIDVSHFLKKSCLIFDLMDIDGLRFRAGELNKKNQSVNLKMVAQKKEKKLAQYFN